MSTPLYPTFEKRVADAVTRVITQHVDPWQFMQQRMSVKRFDGRLISYEGVEFEGSPRHVFWSGYIEPFLQELIVAELAAASAAAKERDVDARKLIPEVQALLLLGCRQVLRKMAEVDHRLRGQGYPEKTDERSTEPELLSLREFLNRHGGLVTIEGQHTGLGVLRDLLDQFARQLIDAPLHLRIWSE